MACLPAAPPALALRSWLGLGLFVLLCLSLGKRERLGWERARGCAGAERVAAPLCQSAGDGGPQGTGSGVFWLRLGRGLGWLALLTMAASAENPSALGSPAQSRQAASSQRGQGATQPS